MGERFMEKIVLATTSDVNLVAELYDSVNKYFEATENYCYPNWQTGKYPVLKDAQEAFNDKSLYVLKDDGAKTIRIDTHFRNIPARGLYTKCGFHSLGCQTAFVDGIEQKFDVLEYVLF